MTMDKQEVKRALVSLIVAIACENSALDIQDQEMAVKYHMGEITKSEFEAFAAAKAHRLEKQIKKPH
jgi:hypothetical protein